MQKLPTEVDRAAGALALISVSLKLGLAGLATNQACQWRRHNLGMFLCATHRQQGLNYEQLRVMRREAWLCLVGLTILAAEIAVKATRWISTCDHRVAGWTTQTDDGSAESVPVRIIVPKWEHLQHFLDGRRS